MQSTKQTPLSSYQITWATIVPDFGKITKRDAKLFEKLFSVNYAFGDDKLDVYATTKEVLLQKLAKLSTLGLHKPYKAFLYTDKQFGMRKAPDHNFRDVLTKKQESNPIEI